MVGSSWTTLLDRKAGGAPPKIRPDRMAENRQQRPQRPSDVPKMFPFSDFADCSTGPRSAYRLITPGGDDGTRTHDPLLANTPDPDDGEH
jgi:hypothetical protein